MAGDSSFILSGLGTMAGGSSFILSSLGTMAIDSSFILSGLGTMAGDSSFILSGLSTMAGDSSFQMYLYTVFQNRSKTGSSFHTLRQTPPDMRPPGVVWRGGLTIASCGVKRPTVYHTAEDLHVII